MIGRWIDRRGPAPDSDHHRRLPRLARAMATVQSAMMLLVGFALLLAASAARLPAILAAISPAVGLCDGAGLPLRQLVSGSRPVP